MLINCRSCDSKSLELSASRKKFPLYIWPLPKTESTRLEDIQLYVCNDCGYIQLQNMDDETISEIYRNEAFNIENPKQNIKRHNLITKSDACKFQNTKVLEIGGGRNAFVGMLPESSEKWVADFSIDEGVNSVLKGAFVGNFIDIEIKQKEFDYVFMFHVLEHFNSPGLALDKIRKLLKNTGKLIIEVPNFAFESVEWPYYTIFHMHISLFTQTSLLSMLMRYGFSCTNFFKKTDVLLAEFSLDDRAIATNHREHSLKYLNNVECNIEKSYLKLDKKFQKLRNDKVAIFGAGGATTLFLFNFPFLIERLSCAFDNDDKKWGRFICNGKIPIFPPEEVENQGIKHVIVLQESHIQYMANNKINYINIV